MHYIGKIDLNIYKCVTEDITTDEVIITDERIQHIKDRHPNDFETYFNFMNKIVVEPDYIIEANKPKSALILKSFDDGSKTFKTVLRLVTPSDEPEIKNSIITFMKIRATPHNYRLTPLPRAGLHIFRHRTTIIMRCCLNEKEWNRLIKTKKYFTNANNRDII